MLDIIICEDNIMQRNKIESIIKNKLLILKLPLNVVLSTGCCSDVVNYLNNNQEKSFIYFLDVDLGNQSDGLELAKKIRVYDKKGYIVFITSHAELSFLTFKYKVQAFDYILKSDDISLENSINECLDEVYMDYQKVNIIKKDISINLGNRIQVFILNEILFFETTEIEHKLRIHTITGHFEFYGKMKDIEAKLPTTYFYKAHRSYIVNITKIKLIDRKNKIIYMINDEICYCSILYLKGLIKKCLL